MGSLLPATDEPLQYPSVRRDESIADNYHGTVVRDPYRWLEVPDSVETKEFVEKQIQLTDSVLKTCKTTTGKLREKITKLFEYPRCDAPSRAGNKYFFCNHNADAIFVQESLTQKPKVLLDLNLVALSNDVPIALAMYEFSEDAKYLAYGINYNGSDWVTIKVRSVDERIDLQDEVSWVKFSTISWTHDSKGFFYSCYPSPENGENLEPGTETDAYLHHQLYYHFLGTDQSEDVLCMNDHENPKRVHIASVTEDGKYLLLKILKNNTNKVYFCDLSALPEGLEGYKGKADLLPFVKLIDSFDASHIVIANDGTAFTFLTNKDAPRYKLVRVDVSEPTSWVEVLQESRDVLESAVAVNENQLILSYLHDVRNVLQIRDLNTCAILYHLPLDIGIVSEISCRRKDHEFFFKFTNFLVPGIIYRCIPYDGGAYLQILHESVVSGFDRNEFSVNQVFVPSKDGTRIPLFVVTRKDISLDGSHPCLLYGYGGFEISIKPSFNAAHIALAKHLGAIFCIANIRGGGEYGEEWHKAGSLASKQNCFDDFIACAEYLISEGYTQPKKLCIEGGSNGGLLVGACINQRPDLFGCALARVGVLDIC